MSDTTPTGASDGPLVILFGGLAGLLISAYLYLAPLTGVSGSFGALLVTVTSALLVLDAVMLLGAVTPGARALWLTLGFLGAFGTLAAGWFLHGWWLMAAMVVVLIGLVLALVRSPARDARATS